MQGDEGCGTEEDQGGDDSSMVQADLCADSSDDGAEQAPRERARVRGHAGGLMSSLQSKWDKLWGKSATNGDVPEQWDVLCDNRRGRVEDGEPAPSTSDGRAARRSANIDQSSAEHDTDFSTEELVGDAQGTDDCEEGKVWGMRDQHRVGNEYTPGEPTGRDRPPPNIVDRGFLAQDAALAPAGVKSTGKKSKARPRTSSFFSAVAGGLGPVEEEESEAEELRREPRVEYDAQQLQEAVEANLHKAQDWYRELQEAKLQEMQSLVMQGKAADALESLRESNLMQPEFNASKLLVQAGSEHSGLSSLGGTTGLAMLGTGVDEESRGRKGPGFLRLTAEQRKAMFVDQGGATLEQVRERYAGWTAAAIAEEMELLALQSVTVWVPQHVRSVAEAVMFLAGQAQSPKRIAVSGGDHEWTDRIVVGGGKGDVRMRLFGSSGLLTPPPFSGSGPAPPAGDGTEQEGEARLWGQWAMCPNSWGSIANVTCLLEAEPRGGRSLFIVAGGSAAFPWVFHSMQARCCGGVAVLLVQRAFLHTSGCVLGGLGGSLLEQNATAIYGVMMLESAHAIIHASTIGFSCAAAVRVMGSVVVVLDKCRVSHNARGLMVSDDTRCLLRSCRFNSNWFSAFDVVDGASEVGGTNAQGGFVRSEMLLQTCRVRALDPAAKASLRAAAAAAADAAAADGMAAPYQQADGRDGVPIGEGMEDVWLGRRLPGWLADKDNIFPGGPGGDSRPVSGKQEQDDQTAQEFRTEVVFKPSKSSKSAYGVEGMVTAADVVSHKLEEQMTTRESMLALAPEPSSVDWLAVPGVVRLVSNNSRDSLRSWQGQEAEASEQQEEVDDASELKRDKSHEGGNDLEAPQPRLAVEYGVDEEAWFPRGRLQGLLDDYGCRKVASLSQKINEAGMLGPLRIEANATGFVVRNLSDSGIVVAWDKVIAGRKHEMLVKCPACQRKIVIRSGLAGKVMCPLKGCRAIFPRQSTSAAVSVLGLTENLDELLRYGHGADLDEADASTHALLPLPGGQLAVVRRDREREAAEHKASLETEGGADTVASAFLRAAHSSSVGTPTAEEPHVASQDIPHPASQEGPHAGVSGHQVSRKGAQTGASQNQAGRWIQEAAAELWKDGLGDDVVWDAETRSKLVRSAAGHSHSPPSCAHNTSRSSPAALNMTEPNASVESKSFGSGSPGLHAEGPVALQEVEEEDGNSAQTETAMPLHLMPGNSTGDEYLDEELKKQGVRFTGEDRPFGMPSIPVPGSSRPSSRAQESAPDGVASPAREAAVKPPRDLKDVAAAAEHARQFDEVYEEYVKRKGNGTDPALLNEMQRFREMLAKRAAVDPELRRKDEMEVKGMANLASSASRWDDAMDLVDDANDDTLTAVDTEKEADAEAEVEAGLLSKLSKLAESEGLGEGLDWSDSLSAQDCRQSFDASAAGQPASDPGTIEGKDLVTSRDTELDEEAFQARLLESCADQLKETQDVFGLYVKKDWQGLEAFVSDGVPDAHQVRSTSQQLLRSTSRGPCML